MEREPKVSVEKLRNVDDWPYWKWQIELLLRSYGLDWVTEGRKNRPVFKNVDAPTEEELDYETLWMKGSAGAGSLIGMALSKQVSDLVLTCAEGDDIWTKLCARLE